MLACTVSNPKCIKHLAEQIKKQYEELTKEIEKYKRESEIYNIRKQSRQPFNP